MAAVDLLEARGWHARLVVAACLSPAPTDELARALRGVAHAVTVEAHYLSGGLGSLVSEVVAESGLACRVIRCGVAGLPECVGSEAFMNDAQGLSAEAIARTAIDALEPRDKAAGTVVTR